MNKSLREIMKQLPDWEVVATKRHYRLIHKATGATVIVSATPSDCHGVKNALADCRRVTRGKKHG